MKPLSFTAAFVALVALGADSPKDYGDATTLNGLEGSWRLVRCEIGGQDLTVPEDYRMIFQGSTYTWTGWMPMSGTYKIDPTRRPGHLEEMAAVGALKGRSLKYIYQIDGDTLRIAARQNNLSYERPDNFQQDGLTIWTFKRAK